MKKWMLATGFAAGVMTGMGAPLLAEQSLVAEPQEPTGKFTTATEVKPILGATLANWVALRKYEGQDWLYVTHLFAWRCGLAQMKVGVNDEEPQVWPMPPCHLDTAQPNALTEADFKLDPNIYKTFAPESVDSVTVELTYDDLSTQSHTWARKDILMP